MARKKNDCCCCSSGTNRSRRVQYEPVQWEFEPVQFEPVYVSPPLLAPAEFPATEFGLTDPVRVFLPHDYFGPIIETDEDEDEDFVGTSGTTYGLVNTSSYTIDPDLGTPCINAQTALTVSAGFRHDPDGITWLPNPWPTWDGTTTINPCTSTNHQIRDWVWPPATPWQMRGLRQMFYDDPPFANNLSPTLFEIEAWNIRVIGLYRALLGITTGVMNSRELYLKAHFNEERRWTTFWDAAYPGTLGSSYGPCVGMSPTNAHCGATFVPNCTAQTPYLRAGEPCHSDIAGGAEGIFTGEMDWPWAIKLSRTMFQIVEAEGITGHGGPFVSRPYFGISYKCFPGGGTSLRIKWNGTLVNPCP